MARPVSELSTHLGYWLRFVSNHVSGAFARRLEEHDVKVAEWVLLRHLFDGAGMHPSKLADLLGVTRGAITKLADRLIARGLVRRTSVEDDKRSHTLSLTAAGRSLVPGLAAAADKNDADFFGHLAAGDRRALMRILNSVIEHRSLAGTALD